MLSFSYRAVAKDGGSVRGRIQAESRASAASQLQDQGHLVLVLSEEKADGLRSLLTREIGGQQGLRSRELSDLMGRLASLLQAGLPVETALAMLERTESAASRRRHLVELLRRLRNGSGLAEAMTANPRSFPATVIAMVRAGEANGALAPALTRLSDYLARAEDVKQTVRSAMIYPAVLLLTAAGSVLLVLTVVLPQLEPVFADTGVALPFITRMAFAASDLVRNDWWMLVLGGVLIGLLGYRILTEPALRVRRDGLLLRIPILGPAIRQAEAGRFARTLGALVGGGVALPLALTLAQPVLVNRVIAEAIARVSTGVREGGGLAGPLSRTGVLPELASQMIRIGEATGQLDAMLDKLAALLEADVKRVLDRSLSLLVPLLTIAIGILVAGIIASVMMAVLSANDMVR